MAQPRGRTFRESRTVQNLTDVRLFRQQCDIDGRWADADAGASRTGEQPRYRWGDGKGYRGCGFFGEVSIDLFGISWLRAAGAGTRLFSRHRLRVSIFRNCL